MLAASHSRTYINTGLQGFLASRFAGLQDKCFLASACWTRLTSLHGNCFLCMLAYRTSASWLQLVGQVLVALQGRWSLNTACGTSAGCLTGQVLAALQDKCWLLCRTSAGCLTGQVVAGYGLRDKCWLPYGTSAGCLTGQVLAALQGWWSLNTACGTSAGCLTGQVLAALQDKCWLPYRAGGR